MADNSSGASRIRPDRRSTLALLVVPAAVAVAGVLIALRLHFEPPVVPPYTLVGTDGVTRLEHGERFEFEVRPTGPVTGAVGARGFLLRGQEVRPWDPPFRVERDGSVRIAGPVTAIFAGAPLGEWEIAVAVGRPETLPTAPRDILRARDADGGTTAWRLVRARIVLGS
jgi:hypothetical protein